MISREPSPDYLSLASPDPIARNCEIRGCSSDARSPAAMGRCESHGDKHLFTLLVTSEDMYSSMFVLLLGDASERMASAIRRLMCWPFCGVCMQQTSVEGRGRWREPQSGWRMCGTSLTLLGPYASIRLHSFVRWMVGDSSSEHESED